MSDITHRNFSSYSPVPPGEMHEIADVRISLADHTTLVVNVDTASQFVDEPTIALQLDNGIRIDSQKIHKTVDNNSDGGYMTEFYLEQYPPYVEILVDVRGKSGSGAISSAVTGFNIARYEEPGRYEFFGPGGATRLTMTVKEDLPLLIWVGSVGQEILQRSGGPIPVTDAFMVGGINDGNFPLSVRLSAAVGSNEATAGRSMKDADVALYLWKENEDRWVRLPSSGFNSQRLTVGADIERFGIYAAFATLQSSAIDELREENVALRRAIVELDRDRISEDGNSVRQRVEHAIRSTTPLGRPGRDDDREGW